MATAETTALIQSSKRPSILSVIRRRYLIHVYPKQANIVLLYSALVFSTLAMIHVQHSPFVPDVLPSSISLYTTSVYILLLFYPVYGYLGERFCRFKVMNVGIILLGVGYSVRILIDLKLSTSKTALILMGLTAVTLYYLGLGLFIANSVQFGLDQLPSESSEILRTYLYWMVGFMYIPSTVSSSVLAIMTKFIEAVKHMYYAVLVVTVTPFVLLLMSLVIVWCCKRQINIQLPPQVSPIKHIYNIVRYAWHHKYPVRRSAYTYAEMPSRLDLAKERYGGPFTTEEVEDVKSFWQILLVLLSMFGVFCLDMTYGITNKYYNTSNSTYYDENTSFCEIVIVAYPSVVTDGSVTLCILLIQLLVLPLLSRYLPRLLYRMGAGMVITLCSLICLTLLDVWLERELFPYPLLLAPQLLYGCAYFLTFATTFEFIIAQAPVRMQGFLIGIWLGQHSGRYTLVRIEVYLKRWRWEFYAAKAVLVLLSCVTYLIVAVRYKYRERNEAADVNERIVIEEYYERQLARRATNSLPSMDTD